MHFIFLISLIFFLATTTNAKELADRVLVNVNDEIILQSELKALPRRAEKEGAVDETLLFGEKISALKTNKKLQLAFLIRERLIDSEVKRLGLSSTSEQIEAEYSSMYKRGGMGSSDFATYLKNRGYSVKEYKQLLKARSERQSFFEKEIIAKLRITDDDAYAVFQKKFPNHKTTVGEFKISQIFFSTKKRGGAEEALSRASAAYSRLLAGEKFELVANLLDETPNANKDGFLGEFKAGEFIPEIERALSDVAEGDFTKIIRGPGGFHIVKIISKKTVPDPAFLKVKESIKAGLIQQSFERQLKNWFEFKMQEASIKIFDASLQ